MLKNLFTYEIHKNFGIIIRTCDDELYHAIKKNMYDYSIFINKYILTKSIDELKQNINYASAKLENNKSACNIYGIVFSADDINGKLDINKLVKLMLKEPDVYLPIAAKNVQNKRKYYVFIKNLPYFTLTIPIFKTADVKDIWLHTAKSTFKIDQQTYRMIMDYIARFDTFKRIVYNSKDRRWPYRIEAFINLEKKPIEIIFYSISGFILEALCNESESNFKFSTDYIYLQNVYKTFESFLIRNDIIVYLQLELTEQGDVLCFAKTIQDGYTMTLTDYALRTIIENLNYREQYAKQIVEKLRSMATVK